MVAPASRRVLRARRYSRSGSTASAALSPTGLSPAPAARSSGLRPARHPSARALPRPPTRSSNPGAASPAGCAAAPVWAPPVSLAATPGILSLPPGTEMFQFPGCPPRCRGARQVGGRVAPFGHPRIAGRQRLPGAFRRKAASFLGRRRQGIPRAPFSAAMPRLSRSISSIRTGSRRTALGRRRRPRIGLPVFRRQCVSGCLCVFCTRTGASTTPSPPSSNGGPGVPAVHGREAWLPRASGCQGANGTGGRVMHRAEDGAVGVERRTTAARCVAVPPRRRRVAAGRSTPVGGTPRDRCRPAVGSPVPRSTWVGGGEPPLPRKEVIQPQLPLRLPCYDFVPITSPALDGCPPEGLAPRLQALPAFVT